ncbi:MAG: hypothetical protein GWP91_06800, partial [Rhodobacterales bacterium]|nr:hypothetical protein [Rhodobacterales bacterium]
MRLLIIIVMLISCSQEGRGPLPIHNPQGADFWDTPWPSDLRRDADGTLAIDGFPNPWNVPLLESYFAFVDELDGFGTNSPVYFAFNDSLEPLLLPTPEESVTSSSALLLIDIDPNSPEFGSAVPVQWEIRSEASPYLPDHLLAMAPMFGFPLRPNNTYAAVVTTDVARQHPTFRKIWTPAHPDFEHYAALEDALFFVGRNKEEVAVATVFTTADPLGEMAAISTFIRTRFDSPDLNLTLELLENHDHYDAHRTHYPSPVFTHGERPYETEGGGFVFEDDGDPVIAMWEDLRMSVCTPKDLSSPPDGGWPVVIYQHGTGGDYRGFCDSDRALEVAAQLGARGLIGLGIDQPLHGPRSGETEGTDLVNFNIINPPSGVSNFRQGAIDALYLAHALHKQPWIFTDEAGTGIPLNPDRVLFLGHSQGGLTGAIAAPFWGDDVHATVLSGAGAVLAITVMVRKDIIDFEATVAGLLQVNEPLTELHPILGLIQTAVEPTDPANYAPYWFHERGNWEHHRPASVLLTSGTLDQATPYRTSLALASAARLPILQPQITSSTGHEIRGLSPANGPLSNNVLNFEGGLTTAALSQWRDGSHWVIFESEDAADLYGTYLETA